MDDNNLKKNIRDLYLKILHREPDNEGLEYFLNNIKENIMTISDVENAITNSSEFNSRNHLHLKNSPNFQSSFSDLEIEKQLNSSDSWYHYFKFNNIETQQTRTSLDYQMWAAQGIPQNLETKSVLDIGTFDGFFSFLCENRNAKRVLAIDNEEHNNNIKNIKHGSLNFEICKKILNSKVEYRKMDVYDVDKLDENFDIILLFGVYYHLDNLITAIQKLFTKVNDALYLTGHILDTDQPLLYYYGTSKYDPNGFSRVIASPQCLINIGKTMGFKTVELLDTLDLGKSKKYPHMIFSEPRLKVGTFKFSK